MNRYTYKAKRKDNGEWVYGYYFKFDKENVTFHRLPGEYIYSNNGAFFSIIPETLCQFTGLQDIEGNYIFENDIVLGACIDIVGKDYIPNKEHEVIEVKGKLKTIKWWEKYIVIWNERESGFKFKNLETNMESIHIECEHKIISNKFDEVKE